MDPSTNPGVLLNVPYFRFPDENSGVWCEAVLAHLQKENPAMGKSDKVKNAMAAMTTNRRLIGSVCNPDTLSTDNRITEGFLQGPLKEYIQLLTFAQSHMNLNGGAIKNVNFGWKSVNYLKKTAKVSSTGAGFEFACMLTVSANSYLRAAKREMSFNGVEGVKTAFKYFQSAAGLYQHIGARYLKSFNQEGKELSADLTEVGNGQMCRLALAYAHHAAFVRAEAEMSSNFLVLSKLAMEGSNAYNALAQAARSSANDLSCPAKDMPMKIEDTAQLLSYVMRAQSNYYLAKEHIKKHGFGAAIGRCNKALDAINLAEQVANSSSEISAEQRTWVKNLKKEIDAYADKAVDENSTLYFDKVEKDQPDPEPTGRPLGKATPFDQIFALNTNISSARQTDPFFGLIPVHVLSTVTSWRSKVRETASKISESVAAHKARTNTKLSECGILAAIQVASVQDTARGKIPYDIRNKILALRGVKDAASYSVTEGGDAVTRLGDTIESINNVLALCADSIKAIETKFATEEHEDSVKRESYGAQVWGAHRKPLREEPDGKAILFSLEDFKAAINKGAVEPLERAKQLLLANLQEALVLDWSLEDLDKLMPLTDTTTAKQATEQIKREARNMQQILQNIEANDKEIQGKLGDLRSMSESDEIAHLLSSVPFDQHQQILDESRNAINDRLNDITSVMNMTDTLVEDAVEAMTRYATVQSTDGVSTEAEQACKKLIDALNVYDVVSLDVNTVAKFVANVSNQIENTRTAADSLVLVRSYQAQELATSLDAQVAQKMADLDRQERAKQDAEASRQRQEQIKAELAWLEQERAQGNNWGGPATVTTAGVAAAPAPSAPTPAQSAPLVNAASPAPMAVPASSPTPALNPYPTAATAHTAAPAAYYQQPTPPTSGNAQPSIPSATAPPMRQQAPAPQGVPYYAPPPQQGYQAPNYAYAAVPNPQQQQQPFAGMPPQQPYMYYQQPNMAYYQQPQQAAAAVPPQIYYQQNQVQPQRPVQQGQAPQQQRTYYPQGSV